MKQAPARRHRSILRDGTVFGDAVIFILTLLVCVVTIYPIYYVFIMSVSDVQNVVAMNVYLYPKGFQLNSYRVIFANESMWRSYANTIFYAVSITLLNLVTSCAAGFALTCKTLPGRKFFVAFLIIPMYFGGGLIPSFILMTKVGLYNNYGSLIIPGAVSIMYIILTHTYFNSLPDELRESASIDGANQFQILGRIYLPLAKPILAVIAIYALVGVWNSWFSAQVYLPSERFHPLQMYLKRVLVQQTVDLSKVPYEKMDEAVKQSFTAIQLKYAMIIFTTLPVMFTYPFFQKHFVKGIMVGSLKG